MTKTVDKYKEAHHAVSVKPVILEELWHVLYIYGKHVVWYNILKMEQSGFVPQRHRFGGMEEKMQEFAPIKEGKVREVYDNGDSLIIVATDRISAFDVILKNKIAKPISAFVLGV